MRSDLLDAVRQSILETGTWKEVAHRISLERGWSCTAKTAEARLSQMLSARDPHKLALEDVPAIIETTGRDYVTPLLLRVGLRAEPFERKPPLRKEGRHEPVASTRA